MTKRITNFSKSKEFSRRIHDLVPGGAHTYSKGDDQFPELSPAAIVRGSGSRVWDLDENEYLDCSMGLTSVSLGHAYEPVLKRVRTEIERGVNFQRPSVLELETAEKFLALVPRHQMVKFAKNGSTVTTAAVKLARAITGRTLVAFPGNHPFYSYDDWFIGRTAANKGVPEGIAALSVTFTGCDISSLRDLFAKYPGQIACVITEPERPNCTIDCKCGGAPAEFLRQAIDLTHENGAQFIVDEMVTGFKTAFPGSSVRHDLDADMTTWGKGIANGFAFCALTGKKEVMELGGIRNTGAEKVFLISTTHGAETHAMAAALATIDEYRGKDLVRQNYALGRRLIERCTDEVTRAELGMFIQVLPSSWLPAFVFRDAQCEISSPFRTLCLQEMIKRGVLFQGIFSPTPSHSAEDVGYFGDAFRESLVVYKKALAEGYEKYLVGNPIKPVFRKIL